MKTLITSFAIFVGFALAFGANCVWAQTDHMTTPLERLFDFNTLDVTLGWSQSNMSITNGLLIQTQLLPTLNVNAENNKGFLSVQNGAGLWLHKMDQLKVGASINYMLGRYAKFDSRYIPLGDVSGAFDAYAWLEWQPIKDAVTAYGNFARTTDASFRSFGQVGLTLGVPVVGPLNAFLDINFNYANQNYLQKYYGVDTRQALLSARLPYLVSQGGLINGAGLLGLDLMLGKESDLIIGAGQLKYSKRMSSSPLITQAEQQTLLLVWNQKLKQ
jgi:outer membrane scaffolding protein for murein synthesis (MipA/OmpV family)